MRDFSRHLHDINSTGAMCLDGSPAGIYFSKGYGDGINKTVMFFNGGGWCYGQNPHEVKESCYNRTFTRYGTTNVSVIPEWTDVNGGPDNCFSGYSDDNINTYNWNRFWIIYCDGTGHQGYIEETQVVNGKNIYFRGWNNTMAHLNFIFSLMPPELTDSFMVTGCSAGGLAVITWLDTIAGMIHARNPAVKVFGLADSGFFVDYPAYKSGNYEYTGNIKAVVELANK